MEILTSKKKMTTKQKKKRLLIIGGISLVAIIAIVAVVFFTLDRTGVIDRVFATSITLSSPAPVEATNKENIVLDAIVTRLPDGEYLAASLSVYFDHNRLEFIGVRQGTMRTVGINGNYSIPIWNSDVEAANRTGVINTMYLDMTGGDHPYIVDDADILLRLAFRLRDSAQSGDTLYVTIEDAIFATVDPADAVAMTKGNLIGFNAQIIVE